MRAAIITEPGGPEVLALAERDAPTPGPSELLVRVEASALNRADLLQRRGFYPAPPDAPQDIPGLEFAGVVTATGNYVTRYAVGDKVMGIVGGGACAEMLTIHERAALRCPTGLSPVECAAIPEAFVTAWDAVCIQGGLESGQWLAIDAVASGVGCAAVQLAHHLGARSIGSSRTEAKLSALTAMGLDVAVHGDQQALAEAARDACGPGAAVVLELVGGPGVAAMIGALRPQGTLVLVGLMAGLKAELSLATLLRKRIHLVGTVLRSRPVEEKLALAQRFDDTIVPLFEGDAPRLRPTVDSTFALADIARAHERMERNVNVGKIVLEHG